MFELFTPLSRSIGSPTGWCRAPIEGLEPPGRPSIEGRNIPQKGDVQYPFWCRFSTPWAEFSQRWRRPSPLRFSPGRRRLQAILRLRRCRSGSALAGSTREPSTGYSAPGRRLPFAGSSARPAFRRTAFPAGRRGLHSATTAAGLRSGAARSFSARAAGTWQRCSSRWRGTAFRQALSMVTSASERKRLCGASRCGPGSRPTARRGPRPSWRSARPCRAHRSCSVFRSRLRPETTSAPGARGFTAGLDFRAPFGTPVSAAGTGLVVFAGRHNSGWGNLVVVKHTAPESGRSTRISRESA